MLGKNERESVETPERIVIVGGGMAAQHFLDHLQDALDPDSPVIGRRFEIALFCEEPFSPYDRVHLGAILKGGDAKQLELRPRHWYEERQIQLRMKERVSRIDREGRFVETDRGNIVSYDHLILATGGFAVRPPVPGSELPGVTTYRTLDDVERIADRATQGKRVVVAGGGLLGLEAARAIQLRGCDVVVVEMAARLLPRQLDVEGAAVLKRALVRLGINLKLMSRVEKIVESAECLQVHLSDDTVLETDLLVFAAGIRSRDELARDAGLEVHRAGGVIVGDGLETSDPAISAIGECARHGEAVYGFVAPGYRMAEVLANRILGDEDRFEGATSSARLKIDEVDVAAVGESLSEGPGVRELTWVASQEYRRIVIREGRIVGAIAVGSASDFPRLQEAVASTSTVRAWEERRFARTGRLWREGTETPIERWSDDAIVCTCTGVTCGNLRRAQTEGCASSRALSEKTGAGTVCGSCQPLVAAIAGEGASGIRRAADPRLGLAAIAGFVLLAMAWIVGPIPYSSTVQLQPNFDFLWRETWWKQVSGFTLLGLCVLSLLLPLRKRIPRLSFGSFSGWRRVHTFLGIATLVGGGIHSGLRMGENLNFLLMISFVGLMVLGSGTALVTALEHRLPAPMGGTLRRGWALAHVLLFWPMPVLAAFHILAVYYY